MRTADEALSREIERGMTRQDILRRAAALGIVVGGSFGPLTRGGVRLEPDQARWHLPPGDVRRHDGLHRRPAHRREVGHRPARRDASRGSRTSTRRARSSSTSPRSSRRRRPTSTSSASRRASSSTTARRSTIDDVIYSIRRTKNPKLKLFGNAAFAAIDLNRIKKLDKRTCRLFLTQRRRDADGGVRPVLPGHRAEGLPAERGRQGAAAVHRDRAVQGQELHARPRERPREERELLALRPAVLRPGADHQLPVRRGEGQRAPLGADRGDDGRPVRAGARREGPQELRILQSPRPAPGSRSACASTSRRSTTCACGGRSVSSSTARRPCSRASPATGSSATTSTRRSIPRTRATSSRSGSTTPSRRGRCSSRRARKASRSSSSRPRGTPGWSRARRSSPQNAKAGGVNVNLKNVDGGAIYGDQYLKWPFSADYWGTRNYLLQTASAVMKTAPFNEIHWDAYPGTRSSRRCTGGRVGTVDDKKRGADHQGDAADRVQRRRAHHLGLQEPDGRLLGQGRRLQGRQGATLNLNKYGNGFRTIYFV